MIEIWSDPGCWACVKARELLDKRRVEYHELILEKDFLIKEALEKFPQFASNTALLGIQFPIVVIDGVPRGGLDFLADYLGGWFKK